MIFSIVTLFDTGVTAGDPVVIKFDDVVGRTGVFGIDGALCGYVSEYDGALIDYAASRRVIARVTAVLGCEMLLSLDPAAYSAPSYERVERAGYGVLVPSIIA